MQPVRIYACGGFGMNIGSSLIPEGVDIAYLDSSAANRNVNVADDQLVVVKGAQGQTGSGGKRTHNYQALRDEIPRFLEHFKPAVLNIVVFSLSGGTGSVGGPLLVRKLLGEGHPTAVVVVGDATSKTYLENTLNTLKSLEGVSAATQLPVVMSYHENGNRSWGEVDDEARFVINTLTVLGSQKNAAMDIMDVSNFFQYTNVTDALAQLATLEVFESRQQANQALDPVAIASLYTDSSEYRAFGDAKYNTYGFPTQPIVGGDQAHFVISHSIMEGINGDLNDRHVELSRKYGSQKQRKSLVSDDDNIDDDGMVF